MYVCSDLLDYDSEKDCEIGLSGAVFTRQMKAIHPNLCQTCVLIFHHQSHLLCARRQDDLKWCMVVWAVVFKEQWALKLKCTHVILLIVFTVVFMGGRSCVWQSYSLVAVFYSPLGHCGACNICLCGGDSRTGPGCTHSFHVALLPSVIIRTFC